MNTHPTPVTPIYLDCDTGVGDALALAYLLATPGIRLTGIGTVAGAVTAAVAAANTLNLLATAGRDDIPVGVGGYDPLDAPRHGAPAHKTNGHGKNGIGDVLLPRSRRHPVDESATELLIRLAHEHPGELEIIATGPLTNLAEALYLDPELPRLVRRVTVRGGAVFVPGNAGTFAEANIAANPEAAADVFAASWPVTLVPLDVTQAHSFDETHRRALAAADGLTQQALAHMLGTCFTYYAKHFSTRRMYPHDCVSAAFATGDLEPERMPTLRIGVDVTTGPRRGQTYFARVDGAVNADVRNGQNPHEARVLLSLRRDAAPRLLERILALAAAPSAVEPAVEPVYAAGLSESVAA
ncbi:nucleoside hydrolase [Cryobacterium algoritolerans]|uniref:Nucleoside hydrolase n=1 Tax=Cryobacterium algoritolerans TaxID=1259184 RepID=A0A4R8WU67_9MICO|nr:nucleoside hydrolase [Cryobacterium algoritolerans]TFC15681.1 nucleoside hydrolase [Cryobacterium algoritolerans]